MSKLIELTSLVPDDATGKRLDQVAAQLFPEHSRARLQGWIKAGELRVNGDSARPKDKVMAGDSLTVRAQMLADEGQRPEALDLDVLYTDDSLIVINKPPGLVVHPGAGNREGTLLNGLLHAFPELASVPRAGIVHRLDKETSGLLVVARTLEAQTELVRQLQARTVSRHYIALVQGQLTGGGKVDAPIGRHPVQRTKMAVLQSPNGKTAITHYTVAHRFRWHTLLDVKLETGRTHQIRVHMASIRHPIVGDQLYGGRLQLPGGCNPTVAEGLRGFKRQALHAAQLGLIHPKSGEELRWEAEPPEDLLDLLSVLDENDEPLE